MSIKAAVRVADSIKRLGISQESSSPDNMQYQYIHDNDELKRQGAAAFRLPFSDKPVTSISSRSKGSTSVVSSLPANDDRINSLPAPRPDYQEQAPAASASVSSSVPTISPEHSAVQPNANAPQPPPPMSPEELRQEEKKMIKLRDEVLSKTGRQNGPDIALKVIFNMKDVKYNDLKEIINENSSITELMNVFAFLVNTKDNRKNSIVKEFSFFKYVHDEVGDYQENEIDEIDENDENDEEYVLSVFEVLKHVEGPLFNIDTFQPYTGKEDVIILPAGIIKRDALSYHTAPIKVLKKDIPKLFTLCILQMINILEKTRGVFGGWTKLFKEMQGGGTKSKSTTKKTRRNNNCRRN